MKSLTRILWPFYLLILLLVVGGCRQATLAPTRPVTVSIGGATAMQPALRELTAEYHRLHPVVFFDLGGGGSRLGEEMVQAGRVSLGASTLPPEEDEEDEGAQMERNPNPLSLSAVRIPIGIDALAIVVHDSNSIEMLSSEQLALIFSGRVFDWADVGGAAGEIALVSREEGSGARHIFEERIMQEDAVALTAVVMPTSQDVVRYVAKTPTAVGYVSRAFVVEQLAGDTASADAPAAADAVAGPTAEGSPAAEPSVRVVGVDGMLPVDAAIQNRIYTLSYPVYLLSRREPTGAARQFIDFALSPAGQAIVGRYHVRVR